MFIAISSQNVVVLVVVVAAVFMLIRQVYRLATGKGTKCSCCSQSCLTRDKETGQCSAGDKEQESSEADNEREEEPRE